jgi:hypothetical protein
MLCLYYNNNVLNVYIYNLFLPFFKQLTDTFLKVLRKLTDEFHERKPPNLGHGRKSHDAVCQPNQRGLVASVMLSVSTAQ